MRNTLPPASEQHNARTPPRAPSPHPVRKHQDNTKQNMHAWRAASAAAGNDGDPPRRLMTKAEYLDQLAAMDMGFALDNPLYTDREVKVRACVVWCGVEWVEGEPPSGQAMGGDSRRR